MKLFLAIVIALLLVQQVSEAQIPKVISYQGVLTDSLGNPKSDQTYTITFSLYETNSSGTVIWTEQKNLTTKRGVFSTRLGDLVPFAPTVRFDKPYWLGIQLGTAAELTPRIPLSAVGYSINALKADTAGVAQTIPDASVTTAKIANQAITSDKFLDGTIQTHDLADDVITSAKIVNSTISFQDIGQNGASSGQVMKWSGTVWAPAADDRGVGVNGSGVANRLAKFDAATSITNSSIYEVGGLIGFGTSNPQGNLDISSSSTSGTQLWLQNTALGGRSWDIYSSADGNAVGGGKLVVRDMRATFPSNDRLTLDSLGNFGIGTANPSAKLDVAGTAKFSGFNLSTGAAAGKVLMSDATGTGTWQPSAGMSGSGTVNYMPKFVTNSTTLGNSVLSEDAGNVSVGRIAPNSRARLFVSADDLSGITPFYAVFGNDTTHSMGYGGYFRGLWRGLTGNAIAPIGDVSSRNYTGVEGIADGRGGTLNTGYGVHSASSNAKYNYGVMAEGQGGTTAYGIYGTASGATTNYAGYFSGNVFVTGTIGTPSDLRFKDNVTSVENISSKLMQLQPRIYEFSKRPEFNQMNFSSGRHFGLIAQEVERVFPELVTTNIHPSSPNENAVEPIQYKAVNYMELIPILVSALQSQQQQIQELQARVNELSNKK